MYTYVYIYAYINVSVYVCFYVYVMFVRMCVVCWYVCVNKPLLSQQTISGGNYLMNNAA